MTRWGWLFLLSLWLAAPAQAQMPDVPLMVVRFQQPGVAYEQSLFYAVSKALETNPDMRFRLVSFSRGGTSPYGQQIMNRMVGMGLPASRIRLEQQQGGQELSAPEVHIFIE